MSWQCRGCALGWPLFLTADPFGAKVIALAGAENQTRLDCELVAGAVHLPHARGIEERLREEGPTTWAVAQAVIVECDGTPDIQFDQPGNPEQPKRK